MYVVSCHAVRGPKGNAPSASREAFRRAAALYRRPAFSSSRPASRGACCATAVNAANLLSPEHPVRHRRTVRGQKAAPLPASREALRRAAALYRQSAFSSTRSASRGTRCATAVNAANLLSPEHPVRHRRTVRGQKAAPLPASREALRRAAALYRQSAGSRTRPASREARRRAAVALRPSPMSPEQPRAQRAR